MSSYEYSVIARILHVMAVVLWIGGVGFVTTVLLPSLRRLPADRRLRLFETLEGRFSLQAKVTTLITGLSGFYMLYALQAWDRYQHARFWWVHLMTLVWLIFTLVLFVFEPAFLRRRFHRLAQSEPGRAFAILQRMHRVLLGLSLVTILGAVAGAHGLLG